MSCKIDYQVPVGLLDNRIILVTGAGDGIGRAAALAYARHGATVILLGRTIAEPDDYRKWPADQWFANCTDLVKALPKPS